MVSLKNKKGGSDNVLIEQVIFIVLNVVVFSMLLFFVVSQTSGAAVIQEQSAKKIALAIDSMQKNMEVNITLPELFDGAKGNNYPYDQMVKVNFDTGIVSVSIKSGSSYSYRHFSSVLEDFSINPKTKQIIIRS